MNERMKEALGLCRRALRGLLTQLNAIGSLLLAYALANPSAVTDLMAQLPAPMKAAIPLAAPVAWFVLVQLAKAKAIKDAGNKPC